MVLRAQWKRCSVNIDYHVAVEHHVYSVPYQLVREQGEVRYTTDTVAEHMPSAHRAHAEWSPSRLIGWANKVGTATGKLVAQILQSRPHPEQGYRPCLGIMQLGRRHGNIRLEAACARALALGSCRYQTVKNILSAGQDHLPIEPPTETNPTPTHANIRNADILVMPRGPPIAVTPRTSYKAISA